MAELIGHLGEVLLGAAVRDWRRHSAREWAGKRGLYFFRDGTAALNDPGAARALEALRELELPIERRSLRNIAVGTPDGRWVVAFEHCELWNGRKKRKEPYQFLAVYTDRPGPELRAADRDEAAERSWALHGHWLVSRRRRHLKVRGRHGTERQLRELLSAAEENERRSV